MSNEQDRLAKKRFFALSAMRIVGALFIMAGFVLIRGGWAIAGQPTDRWIGVIVVLTGVFDFAIMPRILARHVVPNLLTPLIVQASFICASAMIFEAYLSFLGAGTPPEVPSWGNIMADGRAVVQLAFGAILYPGLFLGLTVLAVNLIGDGLRDLLDPRIAKKL